MFNELSVEPLSDTRHEAMDKVKQFAKTMAVAQKKGFGRIRSHLHQSGIVLAEEYSLRDCLFDKDLPRNYKDFLFGTIVSPFINDEDEEVTDAYIQADFYFKNNDAKQDCLGLAAAYLYGLPSISFGVSSTWQRNQLPIVRRQDGVENTEEVYNVFSKDCFTTSTISDFVETLGEIELVKFESEAEITLFGDHHGKEDLLALSNKLKNNPYVIEIKSTNFGGSRFVRKIHSDGVLEILVMKSDERFALWVQTTGRNYRETEAIAQILKERYS